MNRRRVVLENDDLQELVDRAAADVQITSRRSRYISKFQKVALDAFALGEAHGLRTAEGTVLTTVLLGRCARCRHLRKFNLTKDYFNCPVVNIRIDKAQITEFGCTLWERI